MPKITKRLVDTLTPDPAGEAFAWDSELKGFGVRMMPSGVATYVLKYRTAEGRQRKLALGRVGTLTPDQARRAALERLGEVVRGGDPSAARKSVRAALTIADLCDQYLEDAKARVKPRTYDSHRSAFETHVKPLIGRQSPRGLTTADVAKLQADIVAGRTAKPRSGRGGVAKGGKAIAARTIVVLGGALEWARKRKLVSENVARDVSRPAPGRQRRFLSLEEIGKLGTAVREALDAGEGSTGVAAVRFLLLSGCRRMEALALPVAWLDERRGCIRFGDTKSGAQLRPIGKSAFEALKAVKPRNGWAFPAERGDGHFVGVPKVLARLCRRAKLTGVTVHVLRHSYAATAAEMGFSELTIAGLLGHTVSGVTARYAHVPDSALVAAADQVSAQISAALDGSGDS
jgi:integrase